MRKSGAWYTYEGDQLGQGKENARTFLRDNPDLANEIEKKIKEKLGVGPRLDADPAASGGPGKDGKLNAVPDAVPGGAIGHRPGRRSRRPSPRWCRVAGLWNRRARRGVRREPSGRAGQRPQARAMAAWTRRRRPGRSAYGC